MKRLRLIYTLLSLAIVDLGWLIMRLAHVAPSMELATPTLFSIGLLLIVVGALASVFWLCSLLWLVISYPQNSSSVTTRQLKVTFTILWILIAFNGIAHYTLRPNPAIYKSQIVFNDSFVAVQDSMRVLRQLCESIEAKDFLSCHVHRRDSTLIFSVPVTWHLESLTENLGKIDTITAANKGFKYVKKEDVVRLLSVIRFLNRNRIAGIVHDTSIGYWHYPYGIDEYDDEDPVYWNRYLYIYNTPKDTLTPSFKYYITIKDRKEKILLTATNDVPYRVFR